MADKKQTPGKTKQQPIQPSTNPNPDRRNDQGNSGDVNTGNVSTNVRSRDTGELHTKKSVTGSDDDGQAR